MSTKRTIDDRTAFLKAMHAHEKANDTLTVRDYVLTLILAVGVGFDAAVILYVSIFC